MKLTAEILTGTLFYVEIEEDATVKDLKDKIGDQESLPSDRLILMLDNADNERYLLQKDENSLKDYGVQDGSHVYIFFHRPSVTKAPDTPPPPVSPSSDSTSSQDSGSKESTASVTQTNPSTPVSSSSDSEEE